MSTGFQVYVHGPKSTINDKDYNRSQPNLTNKWVIFQLKNLPNCSLKKPTNVLLGVFPFPHVGETLGQAAKPFATMPSYKVPILLLEG
jgi:hypothetical protein